MHAGKAISPPKVLLQVNCIIQADMPENMFISIVYGVMDLDTNAITLAIPGHEPAIVWRGACGKPELIRSSTLALGLDAGELFGETLLEHRLALGEKDILVLYTDGITEAVDQQDEEFGRDRFIEAVRSSAVGTLAEMMRSVRNGLDVHCAQRDSSDDRTILLLRRWKLSGPR